MKKSLFCIFLFLLLILTYSISLATESEINSFQIGKVITNSLNLRTGTDISYPSIKKLNKNDQVKIFGEIGEWYIIQTDDNQVGVANSKYIGIENGNLDEENEHGLSVDESEVFSLINKCRVENNLAPLQIDDELQNVARLKAQDLVENNYFSHISIKYGSPFDMLKQHSINYKVASENIAGNPSLENAVKSWLDSNSHRNNILSNDYNYTGIGVVNSISYGKIIVEFFIGK